MPISAAIGAVGALGGGALSFFGAKDAANTQANAAKQANQIQQQEFNTTQANEAPWLQAGGVSLASLMAGLQPGGSFSTPAPNSTFTPPTLADAENTPGYQFTQSEGDKAIEQAAAASGGAFTGNEAKALDQYNQNLAMTNYNNIYNQALNNFSTNFNAYNTNQTNLYNKLASVAGLGQTTATQLGQLGQESAATQSSNLTSAGAAQAAGTVGGTNAIVNALGGLTNSATGYLTLKNLMGGIPTGASPYGTYVQNPTLPLPSGSDINNLPDLPAPTAGV